MHAFITVIAQYFILIAFAAVLVLLIKLTSSNRKTYIMSIVISALATAVLVKLATSLHNDPRPFIRYGVVPYFSSAQDNGFPSDHTVAATFCALIVGRYYKKIGLVLFALAILIGTSRVIGGVHHAQDVIGGIVIAALGVGVGCYVSELLAKCYS